MTREEAIVILDCERPYGNCGCGASDEEIEEALNMAIKSLEQEQSTIAELEKIKAEIAESFSSSVADCIYIIDNRISELKVDKCDNDHDCEHCDWVECPESCKENKNDMG